MNKQVLYESIIKNVAKQVKKAINESDTNMEVNVLDILDDKYTFEDDGITYIDLEHMSEFPIEVINKIAALIIENGEIEAFDSEEHGQKQFINFYIDSKKIQDDICLRSADYYGITVEATAYCETEEEEEPYDPGDYYTPPYGGFVTSEVTDIDVYDVKLSDGGNNYVDIDNEDIVNNIKESISDDLFEEYTEYQSEHYDNGPDPDEWYDSRMDRE